MCIFQRYFSKTELSEENSDPEMSKGGEDKISLTQFQTGGKNGIIFQMKKK